MKTKTALKVLKQMKKAMKDDQHRRDFEWKHKEEGKTYIQDRQIEALDKAIRIMKKQIMKKEDKEKDCGNVQVEYER